MTSCVQSVSNPDPLARAYREAVSFCAGQRRVWDSNPRRRVNASAVFKTPYRRFRRCRSVAASAICAGQRDTAVSPRTAACGTSRVRLCPTCVQSTAYFFPLPPPSLRLYRRRQSSTTSDTVLPSRSALSLASFHTASGTRTDRFGVSPVFGRPLFAMTEILEDLPRRGLPPPDARDNLSGQK